ncbi:branched-chain amino acid transport system II carrier protein [Myroides sp. LJL116]
MGFKRYSDATTIGFALFAMFFGAGNIILPPIIGLMTGSDWSFAVAGFSITAILGPFLGILAVLFSGDSFTDLGKRINSTLGWILATAIILSIGPLVAIPRTAATTYEIGVLSVFPSIDPGMGAIISSIVFFGITALLSISPSKVVDIIGKYLTPLLLVILIWLLVIGITNPIDPAMLADLKNPEAFRIGFTEGYQTLDVLASVIYAGIIITAVKSKGYVKMGEKTNVALLSGFIAMFCLLFIYGGLVYLGVTSGYEYSGSLKRTELLLHISNGLLGKSGTLVLALCIALACLTTAIALVCATGTFFHSLTKGRLSYRLVVILTCVFSAVLAVEGVDKIIEYAGPFLGVIYPITLTLILYMVVFGKVVYRKAPFVAAILMTTILSLFSFSGSVALGYGNGEYSTMVNKVVNAIPLASYDVPWLIPSALAFGVVFFFGKFIAPKKQ